MKIASLGYNPANQAVQNYNNSQQNIPAFKSRKIVGTATDLEGVPRFFEGAINLVKKLKGITRQEVNIEGTLSNNTGKFAVTIDDRHPSFTYRREEEVKELVRDLERKAQELDNGTHFEYK